MVAVIHASGSLRNALSYNEQKVKEKVATCLAAVNYPKDVQDLTFNQKLNRLQNQADLNSKTKVNSVHISLNFDPSEKLSEDKLKEISETYLHKIGFENQPYLLYQHNDAGHPHLHIVTTNIKADGRRIELHNLGKIQSEKARKEIEQTFGLIRAEDSKQRETFQLKPVNVQKVQYGRSETKRAITNVLDAVINSYKYTSLPELNAVLQQYNVTADRGNEKSRIFENKGLVYRMLDEHGNKLGVPIKASVFYNNPGLKFLEEKFKVNETSRQPDKARIKNAIDITLLKNKNYSVQDLIKSLQNEGIHTVVRKNDHGVLYGLTYIDNKTKCVFNGSDLGKSYSAKGIQNRCVQNVQLKQDEPQKYQQPTNLTGHQSSSPSKEQPSIKDLITAINIGKAAEELLEPTQANNYLPHQFKKRKKKKHKTYQIINKISNNAYR